MRRSSFVWIQIMKIMSLKRHLMFGWGCAYVSASVSELARNRLAYDGTMRVPMAVLCVLIQKAVLNSKMSFIPGS